MWDMWRVNYKEMCVHLLCVQGFAYLVRHFFELIPRRPLQIQWKHNYFYSFNNLFVIGSSGLFFAEMFETSIYFILQICDTWLSLSPTGLILLEWKIDFHNYKWFDDKDIHTKDARPTLSCTEHLILCNKTCYVKRTKWGWLQKS